MRRRRTRTSRYLRTWGRRSSRSDEWPAGARTSWSSTATSGSSDPSRSTPVRPVSAGSRWRSAKTKPPLRRHARVRIRVATGGLVLRGGKSDSRGDPGGACSSDAASRPRRARDAARRLRLAPRYDAGPDALAAAGAVARPDAVADGARRHRLDAEPDEPRRLADRSGDARAGRPPL